MGQRPTTSFNLGHDHRFDPFAYLTKLISQKPAILKSLQKKDEFESRELINELTKMNPKHKGVFENSDMNEIMFGSILADFEQNIFRTAIRDFNNKVEVAVYTFWNCTTFEALNNMIEYRYEPYGANFNYLGVPDTIKKLDTLNRKSKDGVKTNPQKILEWIEIKKSDGVEKFKISDMLSEINLTHKQYEKVLCHNQIVKKYFMDNKTDKKGWYKVA